MGNNVPWDSRWPLRVASCMLVLFVLASMLLHCSARHTRGNFVSGSRYLQNRGRIWNAQQSSLQRQLSSRRLQRFQQMGTPRRVGSRLPTPSFSSRQSSRPGLGPVRQSQRQTSRVLPPRQTSSQTFGRQIPQTAARRQTGLAHRRNNQPQGQGSTNNNSNLRSIQPQYNNNVNVNVPQVPARPVLTEFASRRNGNIVSGNLHLNGNRNNNDEISMNTNNNDQMAQPSSSNQIPLVYNPNSTGRRQPLVATNEIPAKPKPVPPLVYRPSSVAKPQYKINNGVPKATAVQPPLVLARNRIVPIQHPALTAKKQPAVPPLGKTRIPPIEKTMHTANKQAAVPLLPPVKTQELVVETSHKVETIPSSSVMQAVPPRSIKTPTMLRNSGPILLKPPKSDNSFNMSSLVPLINRHKNKNRSFLVVIRNKNGQLMNKVIKVQRQPTVKKEGPQSSRQHPARLPAITVQPASLPAVNGQPASFTEINRQPASLPVINRQPASLPVINRQPASLSVINRQPSSFPEINRQLASVPVPNGQTGNLPVTNIQPASLPAINTQPAYLPKTNIQPASLPAINTQPAYLPKINIQPASLPAINTQPAYLPETNIQPASLPAINTQPAYLPETNIQPASLPAINTQPAYLPETNIQPASLPAINTQPAYLQATNGQAVPHPSSITDFSAMLSKLANANGLPHSQPQLNNPLQSLIGNLQGSAALTNPISAGLSPPLQPGSTPFGTQRSLSPFQPGVFNPMATFAQQSPLSHIGMIGNWDGSSANVPLSMKRMGITHGSQLSSAMQQMLFGDSIDPPDPTPTVADIKNTSSTPTATSADMKTKTKAIGGEIEAEDLPPTTSKPKEKKIKKKNKKGRKMRKGLRWKKRQTPIPIAHAPTTPVVPLASLNLDPSTITGTASSTFTATTTIPSSTTPNANDVAVSLAKKLFSLLNRGNPAANNLMKSLNIDIPPGHITDDRKKKEDGSIIGDLAGVKGPAGPAGIVNAADVSLSSFQSSNEMGGLKIERVPQTAQKGSNVPSVNHLDNTIVSIPIVGRTHLEQEPPVSTSQPNEPISSLNVNTEMPIAQPSPVQAHLPIKSKTSIQAQMPGEIGASLPAENHVLLPVDVHAHLLGDIQAHLPALIQAPLPAEMPVPLPVDIQAPLPADIHTLPTEIQTPLPVNLHATLPSENRISVQETIPAEIQAPVQASLPSEIETHLPSETQVPIPAPIATEIQTPVEAQIPGELQAQLQTILGSGAPTSLEMNAVNKASPLDLLLGLLETIQTGLTTTTAAPTTDTSTTPKTTTASVTMVAKSRPNKKVGQRNKGKPQPKCKPQDQGFQCRGKNFFGTLDSMGKWCVETCKENGCVKSVCECNCNGPQHVPPKRGNPKQGNNRNNKPNAQRGNMRGNRRLKKKRNRRPPWLRRRKARMTTPAPTEEIEADEMEDVVTTTETMTTTDTPDDMTVTYGYYFSDVTTTALYDATQGVPSVTWGSEARAGLSNSPESSGTTESNNNNWETSRPPPNWMGTAWELPPAPVKKPKQNSEKSEEENAKKENPKQQQNNGGWSSGAADGGGAWNTPTLANRWTEPARNRWNTNGPRFNAGSRDTWREPIRREGQGGRRGSWGDPPRLFETGGDPWRRNMFGNRRSVDSEFTLRNTWRASKSSKKGGGEEKEA